MFLRKLMVILLPLAMLLLLCMLIPLLISSSFPWFWGGLLAGSLLGVLLALLLPLAGATRLREPFAWLLFIPAVVVLLILLYQYLASVGIGPAVPVLRLFNVAGYQFSGVIVVAESAFAAYMLTFSIRTGRGI